jgi:hypothetical protein
MRVLLAKAGRVSHSPDRELAGYAKHKFSWLPLFMRPPLSKIRTLGRSLSLPEVSGAILYLEGPLRSTNKLPQAYLRM